MSAFKTHFLFAAIAIALAVLAIFINVSGALSQEGPPQARPGCMPLIELRGRLAQEYHETEVAGGLAKNGPAIVVFASPDGETWTIVGVQPNGMACFLSVGEGWYTGGDKAPEGDAGI